MLTSGFTVMDEEYLTNSGKDFAKQLNEEMSLNVW